MPHQLHRFAYLLYAALPKHVSGLNYLFVVIRKYAPIHYEIIALHGGVLLKNQGI